MCTVLQFKNCPISLSFTNLIFAFFTFLSIFFSLPNHGGVYMRRKNLYSGEDSDELIAQLKARRNFLKEKIAYIEKWKNAHPHNYPLCIKKRGNSFAYYIVKDSNQVYISQNEKKCICQYAQNSYYAKVLASACSEYNKINTILQYYPKLPAEKIYENLSDNRKDLVNSITLTDENVIANFYALTQKNDKVNSSYHPEGLTQKTARGEMVRSKSEQLIANSLYYANVPYIYEQRLEKNGINCLPDFTVQNVRERKIKYWEHLGRMDEPTYAEGTVKKINNYISAGFLPGDTLIITIETARNPLDASIINSIIENYCL